MYTKSSNITKKVQDDTLLPPTTNGWRRTAYQIAAVPMSWSYLKGQSRIASLFIWDFLYSYAAVERLSTDMAHRAVPLR